MNQLPEAATTSPTGPANRNSLTPGGGHRFALEFLTHDGHRLGPVSVAPDFQAAREWAYFTGVRRGLLPPVTAPADGEVAPVFSEELGPPYCRAIRVAPIAPPGFGELTLTSDVPITYFQDLAEANAARWVARGELSSGDGYRYHVCAYPVVQHEAGTRSQAGFRVEALADPIPLVSSSLDAFLERSEPEGVYDDTDAPVFIHRSVLEETCARARQAGDLETGGILVGRLHHDPERPEVFAEIVAQIPARHAEASGVSFGFTPETWAAAHAAIELRGKSELQLAWWHYHPRFCGNCPEERQRVCAFARPFFSADDVHLHRTCFPRAYQVALLISDLGGSEPTPALFGWRSGSVTARGFHVLD